ncbi:MAG TPA: hypothetical protein GXX40_08525 [Firmicutes bacterium]|nr:hypothetical protein [Bacillota bacterium]
MGKVSLNMTTRKGGMDGTDPKAVVMEMLSVVLVRGTAGVVETGSPDCLALPDCPTLKRK